jgi:hypothetical protein
VKTHELLKEAFGDCAFRKDAVCKWYAELKGGRKSVRDDTHVGCLSTSKTVNVTRIR